MRNTHSKIIKYLGIISLMVLVAPTLVEAAKGGGGKGKGGLDAGETACSTFNDDSSTFEIVSDNYTTYCHGTDGQISIPSRYRHDLKKFNSNDRKILVDPICHGNDPDNPYLCLTEPANGYIWQSIRGGDANGEYTGFEFNFQEMLGGEVATMSLGIQIGKQQHIYFGEQGFGSNGVDITFGTNSSPVWVKCVSQTNAPCTAWIISTADLRPGPDPSPAARACMFDYKGGTTLVDSDVEADFEIFVVEIENTGG
jgi:hypothetical protein